MNLPMNYTRKVVCPRVFTALSRTYCAAGLIVRPQARMLL